MKKRGKVNILEMFAVILFLIAIFHTTTSIIAPSKISGFPEVTTIGLTGKAAFSFDSFKYNYISLAPSSKAIIVTEWLVIILVILIILIMGAIKLKKEMKMDKDLLNKRFKIIKKKPETDLDILYDFLKEKKVLRAKAVSNYFSVDRETVMEWFRILEEADLADINYPTVGDPKITLIEKMVKNGEKNKKTKKKEPRENKEKRKRKQKKKEKASRKTKAKKQN